MGDRDGVALNDCLCPAPLPVLVLNSKAFELAVLDFGCRRCAFLFAGHQCEALIAAGVGEGDDGLLTRDGQPFVERAGHDCILCVIKVMHRPASQAFAHIELVLGVDILGFANVNDHGHARFWNRVERIKLQLADLAPAHVCRIFAGILEVGKLYKIEGELVTPFFTPAGNECFHVLVIQGIAGIGATLIPDRAFNSHGRHAVNHCIVNGGRGTISPRHARLAHFFAFFGLCCRELSLPSLLRIRVLLHHLKTVINRLDVICEHGIVPKGLRRRPGFDLGPAPVAVKDADGDLGVLMDITRKVETYSRPV